MDKSCGFFMICEDQILLGRVTNSNNNWSIPKGGQDEGENDLETALRELYEESNVDLEYIKKCKVYDFNEIKYPKRNKILKSFLAICPNKFENLKCNSFFDYKGKSLPEFDMLKWHNINEVLDGYIKIGEPQMTKLKEILKFLNFF